MCTKKINYFFGKKLHNTEGERENVYFHKIYNTKYNYIKREMFSPNKR